MPSSDPAPLRERKFATGRDFYDDEYSDLEQEDDELPDQLVFSKKLYGRKDDLSKLNSIFSSVRDTASSQGGISSKTPPFVLIWAQSGCGKSTLVHTFATNLRKQDPSQKAALFISAKFQRSSTSSNDQKQPPFAGLVQAFSELARKLQKDEYEEDLERISKAARESLGDDLGTLAAIIPEFTAVLGVKSDVSFMSSVRDLARDPNGNTNDERDWNRLTYLFRNLARSICSASKPIILYLDDLQWADNASLDLLCALVIDPTMSNIMVIGSARPVHEVEEQCSMKHPLSQKLDTLCIQHSKTPETIELQDLTRKDLTAFIADTLGLEVDSEELQVLSQAIYRKTQGNIYFARQALEELFRKKVIYFDNIAFGWACNVKGVEVDHLERRISDTVLQAVTSKIFSVSNELQRVLTVAAYTRSTFDVATLAMLMECDGKGPMDLEKQLMVSLEEGVSTGLLAKCNGGTSLTFKFAKFAHDRVQEAAGAMLSGSERERLQLNIGTKLFKKVKEGNGEDWMLFVAADHLNSTAFSFEDSLFLTVLNLECGEKACDLAAFQQAHQYLRKGLEAFRRLPEPWKNQHDISMRLHQASSQAEFTVGDFEEGKRLCKVLLKRARSLEEKLPTYHSLMVAEAKHNRFKESLKLCKIALLLLNELPPKFRGARMLRNLQKVRQKFRKYSDEDILSLPRMTDPLKIAAMKFMRHGFRMAYMAEQHILFMLLALKSIRMTFEFGICDSSCGSLAAYSMYLAKIGDQQGALRVAGLMHEVIKLVDSRRSEGISTFAVIMQVEGWSKPLETCLKVLTDSVRKNIESGDLNNAYLVLVTVNALAMAGAYPLSWVERHGSLLIEQMQVHNEIFNMKILLELRLVTMHLLGKEDLDWQKLENISVTAQNEDEIVLLFQGLIARLQVGFYFGNLNFAAKMANILADVYVSDRTFINLDHRLLFSGLTYSRLARKGQSQTQKSYLLEARSLKTRMKEISKKRGANSTHKYLLMKADLKAADGLEDKVVQDAFDKAIYESLEVGYINMAAIGSELAGEVFEQRGNVDMAKRYFTLAKHHYAAWGADGKVANLLEEHGDLICELSNLEESSGIPRELREMPTHYQHHPDVLSVHSTNIDIPAPV